jgi:hypothetical protein
MYGLLAVRDCGEFATTKVPQTSNEADLFHGRLPSEKLRNLNLVMIRNHWLRLKCNSRSGTGAKLLGE